MVGRSCKGKTRLIATLAKTETSNPPELMLRGVTCLLRYLIVNHVLYLAVAYVSVGTLGTGFMPKDSKYSYQGKSISPAAALKMIADARVA